jgi:hypothetical protein
VRLVPTNATGEAVADRTLHVGERGFIRDYRREQDVYAVVADGPGKGSPTQDDAPRLRGVLRDAYPELRGDDADD